jgi:hypothetical protein
VAIIEALADEIGMEQIKQNKTTIEEIISKKRKRTSLAETLKKIKVKPPDSVSKSDSDSYNSGSKSDSDSYNSGSKSDSSESESGSGS